MLDLKFCGLDNKFLTAGEKTILKKKEKKKYVNQMLQNKLCFLVHQVFYRNFPYTCFTPWKYK